MIFARELSAWFEGMYALAPVSVTYDGKPLRAVQDEDQSAAMLMAGGIQGSVEGFVIVLKPECAANPPALRQRITVNGAEARILQLHTEQTDPTIRITYGKL